MSQVYLLDTNTASYLIRRESPAARERLEKLKVNEVVCISAITEGELLYGIARKPEALSLHIAVGKFLAFVRVLPWGHAEAAAYGELRVRQTKLGRPLDTLDMLIAAHAVATNSVLVSHDKAFRYVNDMVAVVDWATDV